MLLGEGTFHQFHGGVSTGKDYDLLQESLVPEFRQQYVKIRRKEFSPPRKKPIVLGIVPESVQPFVKYSSEKVLNQSNRL